MGGQTASVFWVLSMMYVHLIELEPRAIWLGLLAFQKIRP